MSYEYARIPLKPGLNIICGPNGSGKSSLLLSISVALGQAYTERSKKLSDLVRWGKDSGRVTVIFDNTVKKGKRPFPKYDVDYVRISRYIRRDGDYWFEVNFEAFNKGQVIEILDEIGLKPNNMLIIMHQRMMESFGVTTSIDRLRMVEDAIGLSDFRRHILEAGEKLSQILSEEDSVKNLLGNAEDTLNYWKDEYQKYKRRRDLLEHKKSLERELIWARVIKEKNSIELCEEKINRNEEFLDDKNYQIDKIAVSINEVQKRLNIYNYERRKKFYSLVSLEKEKTKHEVVKKIQSITLSKIIFFDKLFDNNEFRATHRVGIEEISDYISEIHSQLELSDIRLEDLGKKITITQSEITRIEDEINSLTQNYLDDRVREAILCFQKESMEKELQKLKKELKGMEEGLKRLDPLVNKAGVYIKTERKPQEVEGDIRILNLKLASLGGVSKDVEKMYSYYLNLFNELDEKAKIVSENRVRTRKELGNRVMSWRKIIQSILDGVSVTYRDFLSRLGAKGYIRLVNSNEIETAGLELLVGFKGAEPTILNAYTQSGGERSTATMIFLLALQQYIKSPFRAVDEFDVHMDPRNRELIYEMLFKEIEPMRHNQYLMITPGQLRRLGKNTHIIIVQNIEGRSEIKVVS